MYKTKSLSASCFLFSAFCLLLVCFFPFSLFAQQPNIDIDENSQNRIMASMVQNCDYDPNLNVNHSSMIKNNYQIPAYALYQNLWDTLFIRSETVEIPFFDNQLKIMLIQDGNSPFAFPTSCTVSTGYVKYKGRQHTGFDFSVTKNEPVVACFDGVVRITKKYDEYGNTVVIRHYNGLETVYALLDQVCVVTEQIVKAGELIGYVRPVNPTPRNTLHFETRFLNEFFNPEKIINFTERKLQSNLLTLTPNDFTYISVLKQNSIDRQIETKPDPNSSREELLNTPHSLPVFHTVAKGETIYRICTNYNITEEQLRSLNDIKGNIIAVGQKLRVK